MSRIINELLRRARGVPAGYRRNELFDSIEKEFGSGFAKTLREQIEREEKEAEAIPQPQRRRR